MTQQSAYSGKAKANSEAVQSILEALQGLRYGSVEVTVHDGRIVQIERREKMRLELSSPSR